MDGRARGSGRPALGAGEAGVAEYGCGDRVRGAHLDGRRTVSGHMGADISFEDAVSQEGELVAYEYLYSREGMTRKKMSRLFGGGTLPTEALFAEEGLYPRDAERMSLVREYVDGKRQTCSVLIDGTPQFPGKLYDAADALPVFYYRGDASLIDTRCVSVVGTRTPGEAGKARARALASALAGCGFTVVSGLAHGIDAEAMRSALDAGGGVIGVIGTPIDECYPKANRALQDAVAREGLVISQVPFFRYKEQPFESKKLYFPERNVTMAALSEATVVVEAGERSGTRIQARACMEQGRKLVFLKSALDAASWPRRFLEKGALVASDFGDVLEALNSR